MSQSATIEAVDLFCGAGGTSIGLAHACAHLGYKLKLVAINHWNVAIDTHSTNHPSTTHLCESIDNVDPRKTVPGGRLNLLVASPECTHHSNARGGKPMNEQSRASAWHILRWAEALYIENIIVENVREFRTWGPIGANDRPIKRLRGHLYIQFLNSLRALGYNVEEKILNAADFGDPTTRERLFIIARRGKRVMWPSPTFGPVGQTKRGSLIKSNLKDWRTAREIIDWSIEGQSIFTRKRPLAEKTIQRIIAGLERFGGPNAEPFLVILRNHGNAKSVDGPVPTLCASGNHVGVCEPFVLGQQSGAVARSVDKPVPTVATDGAIALVEPFLVPYFGENKKQKPRVHSVGEPVPTVTSHGAGALVEPFLVAVNHGQDPAPRGGEQRRTRSVDVPMPTVTTKRNVGLVEPFIVPQFSEAPPRSIDRPVGTITTTSRGVGLCEPFLCKFFGTAKAQPLNKPIGTVTTKDRFALITTEKGQYYLDIRFRMLQPQELARAQGFPDSYKFSGNREEVVKQIGNAVPVNLAEALCRSVLAKEKR